MERHIPLIISEGEPFARGLHLGRSQRERVQYTVNAYMRIFENFAGLGREALFEQAERFMPAIAGFAPHLLEEIRAMLADHATSPYSICLHNQPEWAFIEQFESIASIIIDVTGETLDVADGPPCEHRYRKV